MEQPKKLKNRLVLLLLEKSHKEGRRITQTELAKTIGVSNNTISHWTGNKMDKLDISVVERLCAYFNCDVADLLYLEPMDEDNVKANES